MSAEQLEAARAELYKTQIKQARKREAKDVKRSLQAHLRIGLEVCIRDKDMGQMEGRSKHACETGMAAPYPYCGEIIRISPDKMSVDIKWLTEFGWGNKKLQGKIAKNMSIDFIKIEAVVQRLLPHVKLVDEEYRSLINGVKIPDASKLPCWEDISSHAVATDHIRSGVSSSSKPDTGACAENASRQIQDKLLSPIPEETVPTAQISEFSGWQTPSKLKDIDSQQLIHETGDGYKHLASKQDVKAMVADGDVVSKTKAPELSKPLQMKNPLKRRCIAYTTPSKRPQRKAAPMSLGSCASTPSRRTTRQSSQSSQDSQVSMYECQKQKRKDRRTPTPAKGKNTPTPRSKSGSTSKSKSQVARNVFLEYVEEKPSELIKIPDDSMYICEWKDNSCWIDALVLCFLAVHFKYDIGYHHHSAPKPFALMWQLIESI